MYQDATWYGGRPRPRSHCVRWDPAPFPKKGTSAPTFWPMSIVSKRLDGSGCHLVRTTEVGLVLGHIVLDGDPATLSQKKEARQPPIFGPCLLWPNGWMDQDGTWHRGGPWSRLHCARLGPSSPPPKKRAEPPPQFSAHFYCGQTAGCIKMALGMEVAQASLCSMEIQPVPK